MLTPVSEREDMDRGPPLARRRLLHLFASSRSALPAHQQLHTDQGPMSRKLRRVSGGMYGQVSSFRNEADSLASVL